MSFLKRFTLILAPLLLSTCASAGKPANAPVPAQLPTPDEALRRLRLQDEIDGLGADLVELEAQAEQ